MEIVENNSVMVSDEPNDPVMVSDESNVLHMAAGIDPGYLVHPVQLW